MKKKQPKTRTLTFRITTMQPLPIGEQVFISGNMDVLGNWQPDALPLARMDELLWQVDVPAPCNQVVEYKITRGSWDTEACEANESIPPNYTLVPGDGDQVIQHAVHHWKDWRLPHPRITGNYRVHAALPSRHLRYPRNVIVWLPPSYDQSADRRYPVLYLQDGEQMFNCDIARGVKDWEIDEWCTKLIDQNRLEEIIVVAVCSSPDRIIEYMPSQLGSKYLSFLTDELKPLIDHAYRTKPGSDHTSIAGASMGGSIAFYAAWTHPDTFSGAACLSPPFEYQNDALLLDIVRDTPKAPDIKLYIYVGKNDELDRTLASSIRTMLDLLEEKNVKRGKRLLVVEDPRGQHDDTSWSRHTDHWLLHLFGKEGP